MTGFASVMFTLLAYFYFCLITSASAASPCAKVGMGFAWMGDSDDCSKYYICAFRTTFRLTCGNNFSWQPDMKVCCLKGSSMDKCTKLKEEKLKLNPKVDKFVGLKTEKPKSCQPGMTDKLPHPDNCACYYDCAAPGKLRELSEIHERECPYLQVFNATTMKCDYYTNVDCGQKKVPRNPCEYQMNQCTRSHCIPCNVRFPSCDGLEDGLQVWRGKERSPFYCECKNQRVVKQGRCPRVGNKTQIFHTQLKKCVDPDT